MKIEPFPSDWGQSKLPAPEEPVAPPQLPFDFNEPMQDVNFPEFLNKIMQHMPDLPPLPEGWQWRTDTCELVDLSTEPATIRFKWIPKQVVHFQD